MNVSVVVPVYNPGTYIDSCIKSLLSQTMPATDFEVIFVDDGSTDDTPERLDRLAAEHSHFRVIHQENSGWPGKPRNVGVAAAKGEYVQFVDQDDSLGPQALERLFAIGAPNNADIVIGKVTSDFRGVPHGVFRTNIERCTIRDFSLIDSLTPHKMFRKAFLEKHGIAYPEGRRRLEDQLYMVQTYLAADAVSIVGDYPCYFYMARGDGKNAGSTPIEPAGYYTNLREILDIIIDQVEPGEFRDTLLRRFYRNEILGRLTEPAIIRWGEEYRQTLFDEIRRTALDKFTDAVPDGLNAVPRIRSILLRENRLADLVEFAKRLSGMHCKAALTQLSWKAGQIDVAVSASQWSEADTPLILVERDGRVLFDPTVVGGCVDVERTDVTAELEDARAEVVIRNRRTNVEWFVPSTLTRQLVPSPEHGPDARRLEFSGIAHLDPLTLGGGEALQRGTWDVSVRIHALGLVNRARLGSPELADARPVEPAVLGSPAVAVIPFCTEFGNFTLDINENVHWLAGEIAKTAARIETEASGRIAIDVPVVTDKGGRGWPVRVTLAEDEIARAASLTVPGRIENRDGHGLAVANLLVERSTGPVKRLRTGTYEMFLHSGSRGLPPVRIGSVALGNPSLGRRFEAAIYGTLRWLPRRVQAAVRRQGRRYLAHRTKD